MNIQMPQGPQVGPEAPDQVPLQADMSQLASSLGAKHQTLQGHYSKLSKAKEMLTKVRSAMDGLSDLGDIVTPDDVVKAAGDLVAAGLDPTAMAGILADMPTTNAEQLAEWIKGQEQGLAQREQQLTQVLGPIQHQLGVSAMRLLMADSVGAPQLAGPKPAPGPMQQGNLLGGINA